MKNRITLVGDSTDGVWIQAVMYFPTDEYLRNSWYAAEITKGHLAATDEGQQIAMDKETLTRLIDAPADEELKQKADLAFKKGVVAGDILASIYLMDRFGIPEPSIKKATHIVEQFAADTEYGDSTKMNKSRKKIRDAFKEYKSVAHLWAAFRLNNAYPFAKGGDIFLGKLPLFLAVSQGLLEFGESFIPYRARPEEPILPAEQMWELPQGTMATHLLINSFPTGITELLKNYDASEYSY